MGFLSHSDDLGWPRPRRILLSVANLFSSLLSRQTHYHGLLKLGLETLFLRKSDPLELVLRESVLLRSGGLPGGGLMACLRGEESVVFESRRFSHICTEAPYSERRSLPKPVRAGRYGIMLTHSNNYIYFMTKENPAVKRIVVLYQWRQ